MSKGSIVKSIMHGKGASIFADTKIKAKLFLGFGVVLAILTVVAGTGYLSFVKTSHEVELYAHDVEEAALAAHIEAEFLKLLIHTREFANRGREEDAEEASKIAEKLHLLIAEAEELITEPAFHEKVVEIKGAFELFMADFEKVEHLKHKFQKLIREELDTAGKKMVADLDAMLDEVVRVGNGDARVYVGVARKHALLARLHANILIGRGEEAYVEKTRHEFGELDAALSPLGKSLRTEEERRLFADLREQFEHYRQTFEQVYQDEKELRSLVDGEMTDAAEIVAEDTEWLQKSIAEAEDVVKTETLALIERSEGIILIASLVAIVLGIALAWLIGSGMSRSIGGMTRAMTQLAGGDLEVEIPAQGRGDEIGEMASAVQVFKDNAIEKTRLEAEQAEAERKAEEEKKAMMNSLADDFEASVGEVVKQVSSASTEMHSSSESMSATAEEATRQSSAVAAASEQASANVQTVATAAEELSGSISEISRQVGQASEIASGAVRQATDTNAKIQGLAEAAQKIGEVVELITDIADQTNLLALNATIEAARAGDAGKGFAVVASEVKNLANQTAKATDEIGSQISGVQASTQEAVSAIEAIGKTIGEIDEISAGIASAVEEQGAATQEIARNVEQAATGTQEVSSNIVGVSQAANDTGAAATQIRDASSALSEQSEHLRNEVDKFLTQVRAA